MEVRLSKWGNSLAMRVPKSAAESLRLEAGQTVDVVVADGKLRLRPVTAHGGYRLADLIAEAERLGLENAPPFENWEEAEVEWPVYEVSDQERQGARSASKTRRAKRR